MKLKSKVDYVLKMNRIINKIDHNMDCIQELTGVQLFVDDLFFDAPIYLMNDDEYLRGFSQEIDQIAADLARKTQELIQSGSNEPTELQNLRSELPYLRG